MKTKVWSSLTAAAAAVSLVACVETQSAWEASNAEQIRRLTDDVVASGGDANEVKLAIDRARLLGFSWIESDYQTRLDIKHTHAEIAELNRRIAATWHRCTLTGDLRIGMITWTS